MIIIFFLLVLIFIVYYLIFSKEYLTSPEPEKIILSTFSGNKSCKLSWFKPKSYNEVGKYFIDL